MRTMVVLASAALIAGCASAATAPVLTTEDVLRVVADHDVARMPAALVTGRRLGMTEDLTRRDAGGSGEDPDPTNITVEESDRLCLAGLCSEDPQEAFFAMQDCFRVCDSDGVTFQPDSQWYCCVIEVPSLLMALRRMAFEADEPVRGRALAVLVADRDSVDFDRVRATAAAAREYAREPLASALRAELADGNLLAYVERAAKGKDGARDGWWALRMLAAEGRGDLGPRLLSFLAEAENREYGPALADFFAQVGGTEGVAGLRHIVEKAGKEGPEAVACAKGSLVAFYSLSAMLPDGPALEEAMRAALFANRGDYAGAAAIRLEHAANEQATLDALDRAISMAVKGELDLDEEDLGHLRTARTAVSQRTRP